MTIPYKCGWCLYGWMDDSDGVAYTIDVSDYNMAANSKRKRYIVRMQRLAPCSLVIKFIYKLYFVTCMTIIAAAHGVGTYMCSYVCTYSLNQAHCDYSILMKGYT